MATLQDLLNSGMSREEINALLSQSNVTTQGFDQPMPQPQDDRLRLNSLSNLSAGRDVPITDVYGQPSKSQPMPATNMGSVPVDTPFGRGRYMSGDNTRVVLDNGNIVDLGRDTGRERAIEKENLGIQKQRAELAQLQAKPQSALDAARAKVLAEIEGDQLKAKVAGTPEYERIQKHATEKETENTRRDNAVSSAVGVLENINNARGKVGWASTGLIGQGLRNIGGTDALSLDEALEPIRASLSFDRLQRMREESKTGGALGQVAVQELNMLQKSMASLNTAQNEKDLNRSLDVVEKHYGNYVKAMQQARANGEFSGRVPAKSGAQVEGERQFAQAKGMPPEGAVRRIR